MRADDSRPVSVGVGYACSPTRGEGAGRCAESVVSGHREVFPPQSKNTFTESDLPSASTTDRVTNPGPSVFQLSWRAKAERAKGAKKVKGGRRCGPLGQKQSLMCARATPNGGL